MQMLIIRTSWLNECCFSWIISQLMLTKLYYSFTAMFQQCDLFDQVLTGYNMAKGTIPSKLVVLWGHAGPHAIYWKNRPWSPLKCQKLAPFFLKYIFFFLAQETNDISRRMPDKICVIENHFCKFLHARDLYCFAHAQVNFIIFKYVYLHDFSFDVSNCNYPK